MAPELSDNVASRTLGDYFWMTRDPAAITGQAVFEQRPAAGQLSAIKDPLTRSDYASGRVLGVWSLAGSLYDSPVFSALL